MIGVFFARYDVIIKSKTNTPVNSNITEQKTIITDCGPRLNPSDCPNLFN